MAYNLKKFSNVLELNKVLDMLADEASLADAKALARELTVNLEEKEVLKELSYTKAAYDLLARAVAPSFCGAADTSAALSRAQVGGVLNFKELLDIGDTLRGIRVVKNWRADNELNSETDIDWLFDALIPNKYFEEKIFSCIKNEEDLNDDASPTLRDIRRKIVSAASNIRQKLDSVIHSQYNAKFLQDAIITQRDGRFVVPVKSEFRGEFAGIVHDSSASGATLFIEPMSVVEINNDLRVLRLKEKEEIDRILAELSSEAASFEGAINSSYKALVKLSLIFAKANLAYKMKASVPVINTSGRIVLKNARHPLIPKNQVVPITLSLGADYSSLIITGPNTGGKTVTLKTIGLITLMAMCGLMIPCDDSSEISVFDNILVDIGDEQSIEQSLSTFSAHITNIASIIENATPYSLVLLDELGAGTDPIEGAALARSILIALKEKGCKIAATTHYAELKTYALDTDGVQNASCEFDVETLKPTYKLLIGIPGRSNAFAISRRLGISEEIISRAGDFISEEDKRFESIISSLEKERQTAEKERAEIEKMKIEILNAKRNADSVNADLNKKYDAALEKARNEATHIIESARQKSNELLNQLEELKRQANKENAAAKFTEARQTAKKNIEGMLDAANPVRERKITYSLPRPLKVGDTVLMQDINKDGTVLELKGDKVQIAAGTIKIWTEKSNLVLIEKEKPKQKTTIGAMRNSKERVAATELDIRGFAVDEGIMEVDKFLDNALLCGLITVTIIHGKGTGVLRAGIQKHLKGHKAVKSYRPGVFGEGENGVTVVELKN
ncbi:MAG: endonuclease MutS2 [Clostridiales bacterium]|nr:endonuclease MutS2 [Candidatus Equinaster intestinalis]